MWLFVKKNVLFVYFVNVVVFTIPAKGEKKKCTRKKNQSGCIMRKYK
jgi:hypothetical protein